MFIEWNESYAIGVEEVDRQHRELFVRFEAVLDAIGAGKGKEELVPLLGFLHDYTVAHFRDEEELHRRHHYPRAGFHREAHGAFRDKLDAFRVELETRGASNMLVIQAGQTLFRWLVEHVCGMDKDFGGFVGKGGAETVGATGAAAGISSEKREFPGTLIG